LAGQLHNVAGMRVISVLLLITVLLLPGSLFAETPQAGINARGTVESAEISGIGEGEISQDIRDAVSRLAGQPFDQKTADDLVARIQAEKPEYTATTRLLPGDQADRVKVTFLLEKINPDFTEDENVNSRYLVERVEIQGYDESKLSQSIREEMKTLVGQKLDQGKANQILRRMDDELRPRHYVLRRVVKGSDRQYIVVVFDVRKIRWIPYVSKPTPRLLYHSKQNFSGAITVPIPLGGGNRLFFGMVNDQDQLIERYAGFNLGFESTNVGTDRLGLALRYARYHDRWQPSTVLADPNGIYRERNNFEPTVTFAFDPRVRLTAGISLTELEMQYPEIHRAEANAATASLRFQNTWRTNDRQVHSLRTNYDFRSANHSLNSDFIYTRNFAEAQYLYSRNRRGNLILSFQGGHITGNAPLFERFNLGDSSTLRGWNKFDVAPAGGNRMIYGSIQYGFANEQGGLEINERPRVDFPIGFHVFYDTGAVGDRGGPMKARHSVGVGFGSATFSRFFVDVGFPIRSGKVTPLFMLGFRL